MFDMHKSPHDEASFGNDITSLPAPVIKGLATTVRCYADRLDRIASDADNRMQERLKMVHHKRKVEAAGHALVEMLENGIDAQCAINRTAHKYQIATDSLRILWPSFRRKLKKKTALIAARNIMVMYRAGLSNKQIAKRLNQSERHVRRIISDELKAMDRLL